jgi:predicted NBD/HSP70 family sugar kinase
LESIAQDLHELDILHGTGTSAEYAASLSARYTENDPRIVERVNLSAQKLGEVMAELFDLFNPQEIVLGGNMSALFPQLKQIMRDQCRRLSNLATAVDLQIRYIDIPTYELVLSGGAERMFQYWLETAFPKYPKP